MSKKDRREIKRLREEVRLLREEIAAQPQYYPPIIIRTPIYQYPDLAPYSPFPNPRITSCNTSDSSVDLSGVGILGHHQ